MRKIEFEIDNETDPDTIEVKGYTRRKRVPKTLNEAGHLILAEMNKKPVDAIQPTKSNILARE